MPKFEVKVLCMICGDDTGKRQRGICMVCRNLLDKEEQRLYKLARKRAKFNVWKMRQKQKSKA